MIRLLRRLNMRPQSLLFLPQTLLPLPLDALAPHNHHNRLIPRLLPIRTRARRLLLLLALQTAELLAPLAALGDRRQTLFVVGFLPFSRTEDVLFGYVD